MATGPRKVSFATVAVTFYIPYLGDPFVDRKDLTKDCCHPVTELKSTGTNLILLL